MNLPRIVTEGENPNPSPKNKMSPGLTNRMDFGKLDSLLGKGPPKSPKFGKKASSEPSDFNTTEEVIQKVVMEDDEGKEEIKVTKTVGQVWCAYVQLLDFLLHLQKRETKKIFFPRCELNIG